MNVPVVAYCVAEVFPASRVIRKVVLITPTREDADEYISQQVARGRAAGMLSTLAFMNAGDIDALSARPWLDTEEVDVEIVDEVEP